ncbi:head GIN domain-containing protein [Pelomonas sp. KK5]|uniref:head GIN domain-containing protein n=1 Tax=Pelomonas sp. KK5 TaxID=1855730 RepID=UPI00097C8E8B|nr:head GIN domain-containing protein [Pelomonas sp. KK5]
MKKNMHRRSLVLGALLLAAAAGAQAWTFTINTATEYGPAGQRIKGSGVMVERSRSVAPFSKLRLEGPLDLRVSQAAADAVRIHADDNIEPLVESRVEGDTLILRLRPGTGFSTRHAPSIVVDARTLQAIAVDGSGDLSMERFKGDALSLALSGSGDLRIGQIEVRDFNVDMRGSGDVQVAGSAQTQSWSLHGSGDVDARRLDGRTIKARLTGSGDMSVGSADTLDVEINGSGDVSYSGRPQLHQRVNGSGEVSRR